MQEANRSSQSMLAKGGVQGVGLLVVAHFKGSQHVWGLLQVSKCWEKAVQCASTAEADYHTVCLSLWRLQADAQHTPKPTLNESEATTCSLLIKLAYK